MVNSNGEFKGSTKQALKDMGRDISELKDEVKILRKWLTILSIVTTVAVIERLPDFAKAVVAFAAGY
jgi:hypothetical protein